MRLLIALYFPVTLTLIALATGIYIAAVLYAYDAVKRYYEYQKLKDCIGSKRIFNIYRGSYCQRNVIIAIFGKDARDYYKSLGYRFYHIFPDEWVNDWKVAFTPTWWYNFFKLPT